MRLLGARSRLRSGEVRDRMIDQLIQVGYVFLALAVISLFICTIPIWLRRAGRAFATVELCR